MNLFAREKEIITGKFALFAANGEKTGSLNSDTDINFEDRSYWESQNGAVGFYLIADYNLKGDTILMIGSVGKETTAGLQACPEIKYFHLPVFFVP